MFSDFTGKLLITAEISHAISFHSLKPHFSPLLWMFFEIFWGFMFMFIMFSSLLLFNTFLFDFVVIPFV